MRFPKLRGTILGVSIIRTIVFGLGGLCWGPLFRETAILFIGICRLSVGFIEVEGCEI